jgi:hypothetical protein
MGRKKVLIEDLTLERFKRCFTTVPMPIIESYGMQYSVGPQGNIMFLDYAHLVAEKVWQDEKQLIELLNERPWCFPPNYRIVK